MENNISINQSSKLQSVNNNPIQASCTYHYSGMTQYRPLNQLQDVTSTAQTRVIGERHESYSAEHRRNPNPPA
jgi:hypothetical protein